MDEFFRINGLESELYKKKYNENLSIGVQSSDILKGANGKTYHLSDGKILIGLHENIIENGRMRTDTLYHELGHALMGMSYSSKATKDKIITFIN